MSAGGLIAGYSEPVTITRYASGGYVNGTYADGATATFNDLMSIQPLNGEELKEMSEAQRASKLMKGYIETKLYTVQTAPSKKADLVTDEDGETYEVIKIQPWKGGIISIAPFFKVWLARVNK